MLCVNTASTPSRCDDAVMFTLSPPPGRRAQGRNHVFKVGGPIPWFRLLYIKQNTDGIPSFVHCSLQLRKKLGWSAPKFWRGGGLDPPPVVAPLGVPNISISVSVCLSVRSHISRTTRPNFRKVPVHVTCGRGSDLL